MVYLAKQLREKCAGDTHVRAYGGANNSKFMTFIDQMI